MSGPIRPPLRVRDSDSVPNVIPVNTIVVSDGDLVDDGGAVVTIDTSGAGMVSFDVDGDTGSAQTITNGNTLTIKNAAGGAIKTVAQATDELTIDLTVSGVTAAAYTLTNLTVDAQGRITTASSGSVEGTAVLSTGETGAEKFLREDGDGTCSWQTAGGGANTYAGQLAPSGDYGGSVLPIQISAMPPYGVNKYDTGTVAYASLRFWPFISPQAGDVDEVSVYVDTSQVGGAAEIGIYSTSGGLPNAIIGGECTVDMSSTGVQATTSFASTITLELGVQYFVVWSNTSSGAAPIVRTSKDDYASSMGPATAIGDTAFNSCYWYGTDSANMGDTVSDTTELRFEALEVPRIGLKIS